MPTRPNTIVPGGPEPARARVTSAELQSLGHHMGSYEIEWKRYRRIRFGTYALSAGWLPFGILALSFSDHPTVGPFVIPLVLIYMVSFGVVGIHYSYWPCPRCGKPYSFVKTSWPGYFRHFNKACVHCGLPKWAASDPENQTQEA